MLKVAVDIRDLQISTTGTKTFLEGVCHEFKKSNTGIQFYFLTSKRKPYQGPNPIFKILEHIQFFIWKQISLPIKAWQLKCKVVFCSDYFVPYVHLGFETIPVFHDAFFAEYPTHYNKYWLWLFNHIGVAAAKRSIGIATPTKYSQITIQQHYGFDIDKIRVVYEAPKPLLNQHFSSTNFSSPSGVSMDEVLMDEVNATNLDNYILHVGNLDKRKNLCILIAAFAGLLKDNPFNTTLQTLKLVLVGPSSSKPTMDDTPKIKLLIQQYGLTEQVVLAGYQQEEALSNYYKNAMLYVFPSINEGFGLPVLEAFEHGVPVLIANNTCLPEVAGDAAIPFDPYDASDLQHKMSMVLKDTQLQNDLKEKGFLQLKKYSWEKTANHLMDMFKEASEKSKQNMEPV